MNHQQKQLRSVLQALALPVTGQLRLYPNEPCKVDRLVQEYEQYEPLFLAEWDGCLTAVQETILATLRQDLRIVCGEGDHTCTDVALRRSAAWRRVRHLARSALLAFDWPLALPPQAEPAVAVC